MRNTPRHIAVTLAACAVPMWAAAGGGESIVVTDATSVLFPDAGAVYRIDGPGAVTTLASGLPLKSPAGIIAYGKHGDAWLVSDIGTFFDLNDGAILLVREGQPAEVVYSGAPLSSPYGLLLDGDQLLVGDFGSASGALVDGAVYRFNLDPDHDGKPGPFPLPAGSAQVVFYGPPLAGVNQMAWRKPGHVITLADDSGSLYDLALEPGATPAPFGPGFVDPVGISKVKDGFVVVDAGTSQVYSLSEDGQTLTLMASAGGGDQFLGVGTKKDGTAAVANAAFLFASIPDGQVIRLEQGASSVPASGAPLVNPFAAAFAKAPKSASSARP